MKKTQRVRLLVVAGGMLCLLGLVCCARVITCRAVEANSWGLSFPEPGQAPVGNATQDALAQYDAAFLGPTDQPVIYLTFDAGYENGCTAQILDTLEKHQVKAAFFLVGNYIEQNPELVCRMAKAGHTVGNHTYHHYDMSKIGTARICMGSIPWMSCSPAGKSWATGSERWRSSLPHPSGDAQKCRCVIT